MNRKPSGIIDGKLKTIEIDKYEKNPSNPIYVRKTGQISYQEAFDQLKDHLEYVGMLPDEYFLLSNEIDPSAPIPEDWRGFNSTAEFGESEGIYMDIVLDVAGQKQSFATGKTLDEDVESFLYMSRIAAECNLMLNGNGMAIDVPQDIQEFLENQRDNEDKDYSTEESDEMSM